MEKANNIFLNMYPSIDLHGYTKDMAIVTLKDFINDNTKMQNEKIVIIHGKGTGILKETIHKELSKMKSIKEYKLDNFNVGITVVTLKFDK